MAVKKHALSTLLFQLMILLSAFTQNLSPKLFETPQTSILQGNVSGFSDTLSNVKLSYKDLITNIRTEKLAIIKDGTFQLNFDQYNAQDVMLNIGALTIPLFAIPGTHINLNVNFERETQKVSFSGENATFHQTFLNTYFALDQYRKSIDSTNYYLKKLEPEAYKNYVQSNEKELGNFLNVYSQKHLIPKTIVEWFRTFITYNTANNLIAPFCFTQKQFKITTTYWDFFDRYPISNEHAISCSNYRQYLEYYFIYLNNFKKLFLENISLYGKDWSAYYQNSLQVIDKNEKGLVRDILTANLITNFMQDDLQSFAPLQKEIIGTLKTTEFQKLISKKYHQITTSLNNTSKTTKIIIHDYRKDTTSTDIMETLLGRYQNKVIYVANWATWCGPCKAEMPLIKSLFEQYSQKDIAFVFLCNADNFESSRAESFIFEKEITGEHYFMNIDQTIKMTENFRTKFLPRYMLIDRSGRIVDNDAPHPGSKELTGALNNLIK